MCSLINVCARAPRIPICPPLPASLPSPSPHMGKIDEAHSFNVRARVLGRRLSYSVAWESDSVRAIASKRKENSSFHLVERERGRRSPKAFVEIKGMEKPPKMQFLLPTSRTIHERAF